MAIRPRSLQARTTDRLRSRQRLIVGLISIGGPFLLWQLLADLHVVSPRFFGSPLGILQAGLTEIQIPRFWNDVYTSLFEFVTGYVLAVLLGVTLGVVLGWYRRTGYLFEPIMNFFYSTPRIALLPLIVLALGITIWSKIAVVFLGAFITILLNTYHGVRRVDPKLVAVSRTFGASDRKVFTSVVLPGSVPFVLAGLRLGIGRALIGVVVAELYAASAGLGYMITVASHNVQIDRVFFGTFVLIFIGFISVAATRRLEKRYASWRQETKQI